MGNNCWRNVARNFRGKFALQPNSRFRFAGHLRQAASPTVVTSKENSGSELQLPPAAVGILAGAAPVPNAATLAPAVEIILLRKCCTSLRDVAQP